MQLPLATLYLSERCNSRCLTCDYWRHGSAVMSLSDVNNLLPSLTRLGTKIVVLSGGEPLMNPEWPAIASALRDRGIETWLLTSGISLAKHAHTASALFTTITVSMDGASRQTYQRIRGLDAFDQVCQGVRAAVENGARVTLRTTVQRDNHDQLQRLVDLARTLEVSQISFLAVDVGNSHAFGRKDAAQAPAALGAEHLQRFAHELDQLERRYAADFSSGFIAESPAKLRRILEYFAALLGRGAFPPVRCNAPEFSAVITAGGAVQPCYFIGAPAAAKLCAGRSEARGETADALDDILRGEAMQQMRAAIAAGERKECKACVCSLWRDKASLPGSLRLHA